MNTNKNRRRRPKVYNKQVINRFNRTPKHTPNNTMPKGVTRPTTYNPLIWDVPSQAITSYNQPDYGASSNINTQLRLAETNVPLSKRFSSNSNSYLKTQNETQSNWSRARSVDSVNRYKITEDLREKLLVRSRTLKNFVRRNIVEDTYEYLMYPNEEVLSNIKDEEWLVKNLESNPYSTIDTSSLKQLIGMDDDAEYWYIVTDTIVLLDNMNFMRVLLNTDKQCNLILPQAVVEEIESNSKSDLSPQAKQALCFISQQIQLNQAMIDEETLSSEGLYVQDEILGCCSRVSEQGYPLILITNNDEILHLKETVAYQILTMREIKTRSCRPKASFKKYLPLNDIEAHIKITIPNELNEQNNMPSGSKTNITDNNSVQPTIQSGVGSVNDTNDSYLPVPCKQIEEDKNIQNSKELNHQSLQDNSKRNENNFKLITIHNLNECNESENKNKKDSYQTCSSDRKDTNDTKVNDSDTVIKNESSPDIAEADDDIIFVKTEPESPKQNASCSKDNKNVMFEITSQSMEDNLKLKSDEWISRFIQIMEEVLTQVLHREPKYVCDAMPPPWTLYEATECTRKKFHNDSDVVDAANKLRNLLFDIGGSRGKVKLNISPSQYMEMYSYGVYLTDALQAVISDFEDLHIAADSLYKLLNDIQDNTDSNNQDLLCNVTNEEIEKSLDQDLEDDANETNVKVYKFQDTPKFGSNEKVTNEQSPAGSKISNECLTSPSKYCLRSNKNIMPQEHQKTLVASSKWDFLNSLSLTKTFSIETLQHVSTQKAGEESNTGNQEPCVDNAGLLVDNSGSCEGNQLDDSPNNSNHSKNSRPIAQNSQKDENVQNVDIAEEKAWRKPEVEPKVIRKFVTCIEFEKKLKKNIDFTQDVDFSFDQDYDYQCDDDFYNDYTYDEYDDSQIDDNGDEFYDDYNEYSDEENKDYVEEPHNMNCFIKEIVAETKTVFTMVKEFCEKCFELLSSCSDFDESDTLQKAERMSASLNDICENLDSILKREASTNEKGSIRTVSRDPELNCTEMNDEEVKQYREVISKSLGQGNILKETLTLIINVIKSKT